MRYSTDQKSKTRQRIIGSAKAQFAQHGYEQSSIDMIMDHAGLTRGGFYSHFNSKEMLFIEVVLAGQVQSDVSWAGYREESADEFAAMINAYLSDEHFSHGEHGCPLFSFPNDVARSSEDIQQAYEVVARSIAEALETQMSGSDTTGRALATLSMIVGAMVISKSVLNDDLQKNIRESCRRYAGLIQHKK